MKDQLQAGTPSPGAVGIVVRRGAQRRFTALKQKTADLPAVVLWDRRQADRRTSSESPQIDQRKTERRGKPSFTWEVADFVVVNAAKEDSTPTRSRTKATKARSARRH